MKDTRNDGGKRAVNAWLLEFISTHNTHLKVIRQKERPKRIYSQSSVIGMY